MEVRPVLFLTLAIGMTHCARSSEPVVNTSPATPIPSPTPFTPPDLTGATDTELRQHLGKIVTLHGTFSMRGLVGPFIQVADQTIYLEAKGSYSWGKEYDRLEGHEVKITGTLEFQHFEPSPAQHPPDYFYFRAETARIELVR